MTQMESNTPTDTKTVRITALGACGDGKSTVLNRIYGDKSEYGDQFPNQTGLSDDSVTKYIYASRGKFNYSAKELRKYNNKNFEIIDTIGLSDPKMSNSDITQRMMNWFKNSCRGINVFLLVFNVTNVRYAAHIQNTLLVLNHLFGKKFWEHVMIVFARCDSFNGQRLNTREFQVASRTYPRRIRDQFNINHALPVVSIGRDNYINAIDQILTFAISKGTFVCDHMKAWVEAVNQNKEKEQIEKLQKEIASLKDQLAKPQQNQRSIWGELVNGIGKGVGIAVASQCAIM